MSSLKNGSVQSEGRRLLQCWLQEQDRSFGPSDRKTFDLIVDGEYAEIKAKGKGWESFDFLCLTSKQREALGHELKRIFLVLNVEKPTEAEVVEIQADDLLRCQSNEIVHYEWNKGRIRHLRIVEGIQ